MAQNTKQAIMDAFIELLNERSFEKITVTDIVNRCDINRNTFYYYYQDIYDVLEELLSSEADRIIKQHKKFDKWQDELKLATGFARLNKRAINHIYRSMERDVFEKYLQKIIETPVKDYVELQSKGIECTTADKEALAKFYTYAIVMMLVNWVNEGMKRNFSDFLTRLGILLEGSIKNSLNNRIEYEKTIRTMKK